MCRRMGRITTESSVGQRSDERRMVFLFFWLLLDRGININENRCTALLRVELGGSKEIISETTRARHESPDAPITRLVARPHAASKIRPINGSITQTVSSPLFLVLSRRVVRAISVNADESVYCIAVEKNRKEKGLSAITVLAKYSTRYTIPTFPPSILYFVSFISYHEYVTYPSV